MHWLEENVQESVSLIGYSYNPTSPISFCFSLHLVTRENAICTICNTILTSQWLDTSQSSLFSVLYPLPKPDTHILPRALSLTHTHTPTQTSTDTKQISHQHSPSPLSHTDWNTENVEKNAYFNQNLID